MLTLAFPGNRFTGEILPELDRLKSDGVVRVIDMLIVRKDPQGNVIVATASDLDFEEATALGSYFGALAGFAAAGPAGAERGAMEGAAELADGHIFDEDNVFRVTQVLDPNTTAVMILFEHTWARTLLDAVARARHRVDERVDRPRSRALDRTAFEPCRATRGRARVRARLEVDGRLLGPSDSSTVPLLLPSGEHVEIAFGRATRRRRGGRRRPPLLQR